MAFLIISRNFVFFMFSFMWIGTLSIIPQHFFLTYYPNNEKLLLSLFLILGTIASIFGNRTARKRAIYIEIENKTIMFYLGITILGFCFLFLSKNLAVYFLGFMIFKFWSNYLCNYFDHSFVRKTPKDYLHVHVNSNLIYQVLGSILAAIYFSILYSFAVIHICLMSLLCILSAWFIFNDSKYNKIIVKNKNYNIEKKKYCLNFQEILFFIYSGMVLLLSIVLTAFFIFFLKDVYHVENAKRVGGIFIGIANIMAIISILIISFAKNYIEKSNKKNIKKHLFAPYLNLFCLLSLFFAIFMLYIRNSFSFGYTLFFILVFGFSCGMFFSLNRNYAVNISKIFDKPYILSKYNNIANYAMLCGFVMSFIVSLIVKHTVFDFFSVLAVFVGIIMFSIGICFFIILQTFNQKKVDST